MDWKQWGLLTVVAILGFACVLSTKISYQGETAQLTANTSTTHIFPYHIDEWQHLSLSLYSLEHISPSFVNPYIESTPFKYNFELGFTLFNALLIFLIPLDPVRLFAILPAFFMSLSTLSFFYLLFQKLDFSQSLLGSLFLIFLPSNVNITGFWFYTPLSASLPALFLALGLYFDKGIHWTSLLTAGIVLFLYPPAFFLLFFVTCVYELLQAQTRTKQGLILGVVLTMILSAILLNDFTIFTQSWQKTYAYQYNPFVLLGSVFTVLFAAGTLRTILYEKQWVVWPAMTGIMLIFYYLFEYTVLIPYPRLLYYFLIGCVPLVAIGLYHISKTTKYIPLIFATLLVVGFSLASYHEVSYETFQLQQFISEEDYELLQRLGEMSTGNVVLSNPYLASTIYPVSKNFVPALPDSLLKYGDITIYPRFKYGDCPQKTMLINEHNIDYVITAERINCPGFNEIFMNNKRVYKAP